MEWARPIFLEVIVDVEFADGDLSLDILTSFFTHYMFKSKLYFDSPKTLIKLVLSAVVFVYWSILKITIQRSVTTCRSGSR